MSELPLGALNEGNMGKKIISNNDDVIDSRDVIARIAALESELEDMEEADDEREELAEELAALKALEEEAEGYAPDWHHGATLIRDSYFVEYAEQLADDIGAIKDNAEWPCNHIDWNAAADELKQDYTEVDYDGATYLVR